MQQQRRLNQEMPCLKANCLSGIAIETQMPDMDYTWSKSNVDIIVKNKSNNIGVTIN